jgi:glycosyltransferase involved in cell wall biosynthesis
MHLEKSVLSHADAVTAINERIKELIIEKYPFVPPQKVKVIPQGFDAEDFRKENGEISVSSKFRITYSGSFLNYYTPKHFLDALKKVFEENPGLKDKIEAMFIGTFPDEFKDYSEKLGLLNSLKFTGYVEHSKVPHYLLQSHVLWMMINRSERSDLHSTGKLYEYFGAGKPIIACVPGGVARESLKNYGAVKITEPDDVNAIADAIKYFYEYYERNSMPAPNKNIIERYDRKRLTGELAEIFDSTAIAEKEKADI